MKKQLEDLETDWNHLEFGEVRLAKEEHVNISFEILSLWCKSEGLDLIKDMIDNDTCLIRWL